MAATFEVLKDPASVVSYTIDWSTTLGADTISTSAWVGTGVTVDSDSNTTTAATVVCSGGTVNTYAELKNTIGTAGGSTHIRRVAVSVQNR